MLASRGGQLSRGLFLRRCPGQGRRVLQRTKSRFAYPEGMKAYEDDFAEEAIYPPIDPVWNKRSERNQRLFKEYLDWQQLIRNAPTVEEKGLHVNYIHKYGYYCFMLNEDVIQYDSLPFHEYITRTHLIPDSEFPSSYSKPELTEKVRYFSEKLSGPLTDVLKFEFDGIQRKPVEDQPIAVKVRNDTEAIVNQVSRLILQVLSEDSYYQNLRVDWKPNTEAFWSVGGFARSKLRKKMLENRPKFVDWKDQIVKPTDPVEFNFQYKGHPLVQIRSEYPIGTLADDEIMEQIVGKPQNRFAYSPQDYYAVKKLHYATNVAGFRSGDQAKCNLLTFHSSHQLYEGGQARLNSAPFQSRVPNLLLSQGVLVSYTKLLAQAFNLGFDQYASLSEPLSSQTIITNGKNWSFFAYQLNTIQTDRVNIETNNKQNYCWASPSMSILDQDGKLNQNVLEMLLKFYLLPSLVERKIPAMPYLKGSLDDVVEDDIQRFQIWDNFQGIYSQKLLTLNPMPEIYHWEKFYKVDHKLRPLDARRRFFEVPGEDPYWEKQRYYNSHYKPKMLKKLEAELAAKKEEEKLKAVRAAQKAKFRRSSEEQEQDE